MSNSPYLSIITTCRNDGYSGGTKRLEYALNLLVSQLESAQIESEMIFVDWNAPPDKPPMRNVVRWPTGLRYCTIRVVEVPPRIHQTFKDWRKRPIHGSAASSIGWRRAKGTFGVWRASDAFWSQELVDRIALSELQPGKLYRVDRKDVPSDIECAPDASAQEFLNLCRDSVFRVNSRGEYQHRVGEFEIPRLHTNACGDFLLISTENCRDLRGMYETESVNAVHTDSTFVYCAHASGIEEVMLPDDCCVYKISHNAMFNTQVKEVEPWLERMVRKDKLPGWVHKVVKPNNLVKLSRALFGGRRVYVRGVRSQTWAEYTQWIKEILTHERDFILNGPNWGFIDEPLDEYVVDSDGRAERVSA